MRCVGIEVRIACLEAGPFTTFKDALVICRGIIVAEGDTATVTPRDVPSLGVVIPGCFVQIIGNPRSEVVVAELEQSCHIFFTTHDAQYGLSGIVLQLLEESVVMLVDVNDLADFPVHQLVKRVLLQQGVPDIGDSRSGKTGSHPVKFVQIGFQVFLGEVTRHFGYVIKEPLPVHVTYFGEF